MEISLSASVFDNGGVAYGRLVGGQMDPANQRLTHVLLQTGKGPRELLLPVEELSTASQGMVWLHRSVEELLEESVVRHHAPDIAGAAQPAAEQVPVSTVFSAANPSPDAPLTVTVRPNTPVLARDGAVGHLLRLGVRPHTGAVTHFVACVRHFFREKEITFDWNLIERTDENGLYVKMDKKDVHALIS